MEKQSKANEDANKRKRDGVRRITVLPNLHTIFMTEKEVAGRRQLATLPS